MYKKILICIKIILMFNIYLIQRPENIWEIAIWTSSVISLVQTLYAIIINVYAMKIFLTMWKVNSFAGETRESAKLVNKIETVM